MVARYTHKGLVYSAEEVEELRAIACLEIERLRDALERIYKDGIYHKCYYCDSKAEIAREALTPREDSPDAGLSETGSPGGSGDGPNSGALGQEDD